MEQLSRLAELINDRNKIAATIAKIIGRPAEKCYVGEYIAAEIFSIELEKSASCKGYDGHFIEGSLSGRTVNIKFYSKNERILDINPDGIPDYYLVLSGPKTKAALSRGSTRPWVIKNVFLFEGPSLVEELQQRGVKIGTASSIKRNYWKLAEIYPKQENKQLYVSKEQKNRLMLFS